MEVKITVSEILGITKSPTVIGQIQPRNAYRYSWAYRVGDALFVRAIGREFIDGTRNDRGLGLPYRTTTSDYRNGFVLGHATRRRPGQRHLHGTI